MWTRALLKQNGMIAFKRNYWACVGVTMIAAFLGGSMAGGGLNFNYNVNNGSVGSADLPYNGGAMVPGSNLFTEGLPMYFFLVLAIAALVGTIIGLAVSILVSNVVMVGCNRYFLENREHKTNVSQVFYGFQDGRYSPTVWVMFLRTLYVFGWSLLFLIPGIIKSYSYMMVPYILAEDVYMDRKRVFELSSQMMYGHKMEAFVLSLSFIGWHLLGALTFGMVDIFYTNPYINATFAEFYSALKAEALQKGILHQGELPGVGTVEE